MEDMRFNNPIVSEEKKIEEIKNPKKSFGRKFLITIIIIVVLGVVATSIYFAINFYLKAQKLESQNQMAAVGVVENVISEVGKLIVLPTDEEPTVATISDAEKLRDQPFFAKAKNGDKVLIYTKAEKAILYDPVAKKIVEVAPLNMNSTVKTSGK
jgi:uncharacterized membrane protein YcjF (UPF0283 family)